MTTNPETLTTVQQETRRNDLSRYDTRALIEVVVRPTNAAIAGHLVPGARAEKRGDGYVLLPGDPQRLLVPESRLAEIEASAENDEDRALFAHAEKMHERKLSRWVESGQKADTYPGSVAGEFHKLCDPKRGMPAIVSFKVISRGHAPALDDSQRQNNAVLAQLLSLLGGGAQTVQMPAPVVTATATAPSSSESDAGHPRRAAKPPST